MAQIIVVDDQVRMVTGHMHAQRVLVDPPAIELITGWALKAEGLCEGATCVPVKDVSGLYVDGLVDLVAVAKLLNRPLVSDPEPGIVTLAVPAQARATALHGRHAAPFTLDDLEGEARSLEEWRGLKKLIVAFASWCGCRDDLPGWQLLHEELCSLGFTVVGVAFDQHPDDVTPFTKGITFPVLVDRHHILSEIYAISNVPTVIWIDEDDRIVRPNTVAFGDDRHVEFTGIPAGPHLEAVRHWVRSGETPTGPDTRVADLSEAEVLARLHFRLAAEAARRGFAETARRHFETAGELAPMDFTVRRAAMPFLGRNPFGREFLELFREWDAIGRPYHGLPAVTSAS